MLYSEVTWLFGRDSGANEAQEEPAQTGTGLFNGTFDQTSYDNLCSMQRLYQDNDLPFKPMETAR